MKILRLLIVTGLVLTVFSSTASAGLVAHWSFDNQSDPGCDDSGNSHNGTFHPSTGGPTWENSMMRFDGVDDYMSAADPGGDFALTSALGIVVELALESEVTSNYRLVCKRDDSGGYGYAFDITDDGYLRALLTGSDALVSDVKVPVGQAVTLAMTWDGTTNQAAIHIGSLSWSRTCSNMTSTSYELRIASQTEYTGGANHFKGLIDDVKIYDTAVPEPATLLMVGVGCLGLMRKRRT